MHLNSSMILDGQALTKQRGREGKEGEEDQREAEKLDTPFFVLWEVEQQLGCLST